MILYCTTKTFLIEFWIKLSYVFIVAIKKGRYCMETIIYMSLSILSTFIALLSIYLSQLKKGKLVLPPIRGYRLEPLNFFEGDKSYRGARVFLMLTFMNTGAQPKAIQDLRLKLSVPEKDKEILFSWENECSDLNVKDQRFASQPTIGPYSSISRVYSFSSPLKAEEGELVKELEAVCQKTPKTLYAAEIQLRGCGRCWQTLRKIAICPNGATHLEYNFELINDIN